MIKFPYVMEYNLFERVELGYAEELLNEYNDFFAYNKAHVGDIHDNDVRLLAKGDFESDTADQTEEEHEKSIAEHNAATAVRHFTTLFGCGDFPESTLIGLKLDYYDLQQILLEEYKIKTPITESKMNEIAPKLRTVASVLIFAERVVSGLKGMQKDLAGLSENEQAKARVQNEKVELAIEFAKDGFKLLFERLQNESLNIPEYSKIKAQMRKMKSVEAYIDFCETLFFGKKQ